MYRITQSRDRVVVKQSQPLLLAMSAAGLLFGIVLAVGNVPGSPVVGALSMLILIVFPLLWMQSATYTFDRHLRRMTYSRRGPMLQKSGGTVPFSEIKSIDYESHSKPGFGYRVVITTDNGKIPMGNTYTFKWGLRECYEYAYGAVFDNSTFDSAVGAITSDGKSLGNDDEISDELRSNVLLLLKNKRKIEAIKLVRTETGMDLQNAKEYVDRLIG